MNPIIQGIESGYSPEEILQYLSKSLPQLVPKITKAMNKGYGIKEILGFLSQSTPQNTKGMSEIEIQNRSKEQQGQIVKNGLAAAGSAIATPLAANAARSALSRALPRSLQSGLGSIGNSISQSNANVDAGNISPLASKQEMPQEGMLSQGSTSSQPPVNQNIPNVSQSIPKVQPEGISNPKEYLEKLGIRNSVDDLLKRGNTPEGVMASLQLKGGMGKAKTDPELLANIEAYSKLPKENENAVKNEQIPEDHEKVSPEVEESSIVASPNGIGEVKALRNGKAIVEIDGKKHQVNEDELESEPEEVKNSKFDFDVSDIPEDLRSAPLNEVYLPYDKRHVTVKYNAGLKPVHYIYFRKDGQPITNDYVNKIVQGTQLPISSGLNFWGAWDASKSDSRGSANYHELVNNAQEEGQKDDPSKEYWFIKEEALYEHPYMKRAQDVLKTKEKEFNEARKKPKKKRA